MTSLATPLRPLTLLQRRVVWMTAVLVGITRIWARSATLWDWDEAQFALALREYDVVLHQPHPPGFPLFVGLANALDAMLPDFLSLQVVVVASACALFPLVFLLGRELRLSFAGAFSGALLFVFLPNVWLFGGTGFSDVPGLALLLAACVLLLRGCRESRSYYAGALVLGLAAAIRPQALIVACAPALVASWYRVRRSSLAALLSASSIGLAVIAASYAIAALASASLDDYLATLGKLREYVRAVDSYLSPDRPPLGDLWPRFFLAPFPGGDAAKLVAALAAVAVAVAIVLRLLPRARRQDGSPAIWLLLAMFLPFNLFGFLMLDIHSISRYSIGYAPLYAMLAAQGLAYVAAVTRRAAPFVTIALVALLAGRFAWWTIPPLEEVRRSASPPVAAMRWTRANTGPDAQLYVHGSLRPYSRLALADRLRVEYDDVAELQLAPSGSDEWVLTEGTPNCAAAQHFVRERGRLFEMVRERYFEVTVMPRSCLAVFGPGWHGEEWVGKDSWQWMGSRSEMRLSPVRGPAKLRLVMTVPHELVPQGPVVSVSLNGSIVDRFVPSESAIDRTWVVTPRPDGWNDLVIETDKVLNPKKEGLSDDPRDLGLQLIRYGWEGEKKSEG